MQDQEWSAVVNTTTADYLKGISADLTIRDQPVFAMLNRRKRISYGQSGTELRWQVQFSNPTAETYTGGAIDFMPSDKYRQLKLDWRGLTVADKMEEKEKLMNRGAPALIDRYARIFPDMEQALREQFCADLYVNGNTYTDRFHGLETIFGTGSTYTTVAADLIAVPDSTYGGLSTRPGGIAGSWSAALGTKPNASLATDWPLGTGDTEYDFMAPKLVNYSSTTWGTGGTTWIANAERALRWTAIHTKSTLGKSGTIDLFLMTPTMYYEYLNAASALRTVIVPARELIELGFDGVQQEGVQLTHEYGVPASTCYALNMDKMELHMMYDSLFVNKGPDFDIRTTSYLWLLLSFGNWKYVSPKFFAKLYPYA